MSPSLPYVCGICLCILWLCWLCKLVIYSTCLLIWFTHSHNINTQSVPCDTCTEVTVWEVVERSVCCTAFFNFFLYIFGPIKLVLNIHACICIWFFIGVFWQIAVYAVSYLLLVAQTIYRFTLIVLSIFSEIISPSTLGHEKLPGDPKWTSYLMAAEHP